MAWYSLTAVIVVLDQIVKKWISSILPLCDSGYCESVVILPVFRFTLLHNEGAAFSFLDNAGGWQRWFLIGVSSSVSLALVVWLYRVPRSDKLLALALAMILGGALGNLFDRITLGYVIDFVVVHYRSYYFPAFNVADSAISVGAFLLIVDMLFPREPDRA